MHRIPSGVPRNAAMDISSIAAFLCLRRRDSKLKSDLPVASQTHQFKNWCEPKFASKMKMHRIPSGVPNSSESNGLTDVFGTFLVIFSNTIIQLKVVYF
mgnify:CR=1 FL=1